MTRRNSLYPHSTKPELIDSGDYIEVEYPQDGGITIIKRGIVAYVQVHAGMRHILTQEGSVIAVWQPGTTDKNKYTLIGRTVKQTPMFDMFTEMGRI